MPHNEPCPACGFLLPDWHWEWHSTEDYLRIYRGDAGMECPLCGAVVMHTSAAVPLTQPPAASQVQRVKRDVTKAAYWARNASNTTLERYLGTPEGRPYANYWTDAAVQQADQQAAANP